MVVSWWLVWVNGVGGVFQDHVTQFSNWVKMNRSYDTKDHTMARLGNWVTMALFALGMGERGERGETMGEYWGKELWPPDNFPQLMIYLINRKIICQSSLSAKAQVLLSVFYSFQHQFVVWVARCQSQIVLLTQIWLCDGNWTVCDATLRGFEAPAHQRPLTRWFPLHLCVLAGANGNPDSRNRDRVQ